MPSQTIVTASSDAVKTIYVEAIAEAEIQIAELHLCISNLEADRDVDRARIADLEGERDIYRDIATAAIHQLHRQQKRIDYLDEQADRLFDENRLLRSRDAGAWTRPAVAA